MRYFFNCFLELRAKIMAMLVFLINMFNPTMKFKPSNDGRVSSHFPGLGAENDHSNAGL